MKRSFWQHTLATLALVVALPAAVFAQANPVVINDNNVVVPNGAAAADYLLTEFPDTLVEGGVSEAVFTVLNNGDADLEVGFISGSTEFTVTQSTLPGTSTTVAAGGELSFTVKYDPNEVGVDAEALTIPTNVGDYVLNLTGEGVNELAIQANLTARWADKKGVIKPLKVKLDKKSGQFKVTGQVIVENTGGIEVLLADAEIWYSADNILDESADTNLGSLKKPLKKIKVAKTPKPGKPIKYKSKKAKVQVLAPSAEGFIFVKIILTSPAGQEFTYFDNVVSLGL